jgi:hypothetical protein
VVVGQAVELGTGTADRGAGSLPSQIKSWASRHNIELPDGWKASAARHLVSQWAEQRTQLPDEVLDRAARLFGVVRERFRQMR